MSVSEEEWQRRKERARAFVGQPLKAGRAWSSLTYGYLPTLYRVVTSTAVYGVEVEDGRIVRAAPICKCVGQEWAIVRARLEARGASINPARLAREEY